MLKLIAERTTKDIGRVFVIYKHIVPTKSTPNAPNQEINGMNAFWHSPGMNAIKAFPVWHLLGLKSDIQFSIN